MAVRGRSFLAAKHRPCLLLLSLLLAASSIPHRAAIIVVGAFSSPARHSSSFRSTGLDDNNNAPTHHHRHHPPSSSSGTTTSSIAIGIPNARQSSCSRCHDPSTALRSAAGTSEISKEEQIAATVAAAAAAAASDNDDAPGRRRRRHYDAVIVGGGPAGLLSAIMMAQQLSKPSSTSSSSSTSTSSSNTSSPRIVVYDRLPPPPSPDDLVYAADVSKYYLLGLGHRGQAALKHFDAWDDVERASVAVAGRRGWSPGKTEEEDGVITLAKKTVTSRVLPRDKLVGVLKRVLEERYGDAVELRYGWQVDPISFGNEDGITVESGESDDGDGPPVKLQISRCIPAVGASAEGVEECSIEGDDDATPSTITTNFLIGTDGAARTIANAMEANDAKRKRPNPLERLLLGKTTAAKTTTPFAVKRYEDDNPRVYKSVPIEFPSRWPHNLNYSARSSGNRVTFEALPSNAEGTYCALLLMTPDDPLASANCDPKALREFFDEEFPQFSKLLDDGAMGDVAGKGASSLPSFRYAGPRLHEGRRTVILGDCVHTVKPYFGLGANTALEDVQILSKILSKDDNNNTPAALENLHDKLRQFTKERAVDSKALVTISRNMDRPGKLGTFRFVFPLILDSTFHKFLPKLFAPGMFGMFQMEGVGFGRIRNRKRLDRVMQSAVIMGVLYGLGAGARLLVKSVARMLGVGNYVVGGSLVALFGAVGTVRKLTKAEGK